MTWEDTERPPMHQQSSGKQSLMYYNFFAYLHLGLTAMNACAAVQI